MLAGGEKTWQSPPVGWKQDEQRRNGPTAVSHRMVTDTGSTIIQADKLKGIAQRRSKLSSDPGVPKSLHKRPFQRSIQMHSNRHAAYITGSIQMTKKLLVLRYG
jgi:hypothetical protein